MMVSLCADEHTRLVAKERAGAKVERVVRADRAATRVSILACPAPRCKAGARAPDEEQQLTDGGGGVV